MISPWSCTAYSAPMATPRGARTRADVVIARLAAEYPGSAPELCELVHDTPFELLAATILSAQSTDKTVNTVTPALLARYPTPPARPGTPSVRSRSACRVCRSTPTSVACRAACG